MRNPTTQTKEYNRQRSNAFLKKKREKGLARSREKIRDDSIVEIDGSNEVSIEIPYTGSLSKNVILGRGDFGGRVFMKAESRDVKEEISFLLSMEIKKKRIKFVTGKVWIDIFVQKPNAGSGDAINTLDLIADAIVDAIEVDDRWFCVRSIDWEIRKENPKIKITVCQGRHEPQGICSYCGHIQPISKFNKIKSGYSRMCNDCRKKS